MGRRVSTAAGTPLTSDELTGHTGALLDDMLALYIDWRECASLSNAAYRSWCGASAFEADIRFGAYCAALEQEEAAAGAYAAIVRELTRWLQ